ncbi:MAG: undecaprenyl/decaprenyl-phosphate alpha-N-acetylglucosaminyl 1-phosphate transferase [Polyangiaceae bacterium]|nr:undecaprenyl/decaprenyl-phosphate alpha-N-acetylglucosaminyl 1-phosphate transferase [Polyangiaceae bacterium]
MRSYVAAFFIALLIAAALTPIVRLLAIRLGAMSRPGGRHVNRRSVPRLGGISIALAVSAPVAALLFSDSGVATTIQGSAKLAYGLLAGAAIMCVVGAVDDTRGLRAMHKLIAQVACALIAFAAGFRIEAISLPFVGSLSMGIFALPITVAWIVGITNAVNLIDGLDGLAAGVVFFAAVTNFTVAYISSSVFVAVLMAAMMGALIGFLFYNFNPARIFMGDSGSYFLGYVLATASLAGAAQKASTTVSLLVPVVALGVPIFDTLFSVVRRWLERRPLFSPDRGHIHHRLIDMGLTHRRAVLILYGVSIVLTVSAVGISLGRSWEVGVALLAVTVVMTGLIRSVGYFEYLVLRKRQKSRLYERHTERLRRAIPELPAALAATRSEDDVLGELAALAESAELGYVEVLRNGAAGEECAFKWSRSEHDTDLRGLVSARFPIGRDDNARAILKFGWRPETEEVSPQDDVLLQLVTDIVASNLSRLASPLAPAPAQDADSANVVAPAPAVRKHAT